ncbi:MAG: hypothetical protein ACFFCQ_11135 [Promethearchaeota archaeon]
MKDFKNHESRVLDEIIERLLAQMKYDRKERGRFVYFTQDHPGDEKIVSIWALKQGQKNIMETQMKLKEFPEVKIKINFIEPKFFVDVVEDIVDVPFWQISTVVRLLSNCKPIYDPEGLITYLCERIKDVSWKPETIFLKVQSSEGFLHMARRRIMEDMLADAFLWIVKAGEEAICTRLMRKGTFNIITAELLLDSLRVEAALHDFYVKELLGIDNFTPEKLKDALNELEKLGKKLYYANERTKRKTWILSAFVSINECDRRVRQLFAAVGKKGVDSEFLQRIYETAIGELWQAVFLLAQNPMGMTKLDPWLVGFFWKWFILNKTEKDAQRLIRLIHALNINETHKLGFEGELAKWREGVPLHP